MKKYDILFSFGQFLMDCRMNEAAHFVFLTAVKTPDPALKSKAFTQAARIAMRHKRFQAGLSYSLEAVKANPKNDDAWLMAAIPGDSSGLNPEITLKYVNQAIFLKSDDPDYYDQKIILLTKLNRIEEAKQVADVLIAKFPNYSSINTIKKKQAGLDLLIADKKGESVRAKLDAFDKLNKSNISSK